MSGLGLGCRLDRGAGMTVNETLGAAEERLPIDRRIGTSELRAHRPADTAAGLQDVYSATCRQVAIKRLVD